VAGEGLALGYWRDPERTAERFVESPALPGERLYRTGDLARHLPDGNLDFRGRRDQQIKLRGFRIELAEIELALTSLEAVAEAAVVLREDLPGGRGLMAYVVGRGGAELSAGALQQALREQLPDYMVPAGFVELPALPLTPNGKVDRRWLAERGPLPESLAAGAARIPPRTATEELVAGMFAAVLGLEEVGAEADFFALGGHSLLATQLISRAREAFGIDLPLRAAFEHPTVAGLAREVDKASRLGGVPLPPLVRIDRQGDLPLSFAQQRLWFIDQMESDSAYHVPVALRLSGELSVPVLSLALTEVVRRHETLRTRFAAGPAGPVQVILPPAPLALPVVDLSGLPDRSAAAALLLAEEAARPFDLARGPLLRGLVLRLAEGEHTLALSLHHIVSDGWSMGVLVREVGALYPAFLEGRPSPLPELAIQYADFAAWQRRILSGDLLTRELAWWREQLAGMPQALELPADRPRPAALSVRGGALRFAIDRATHAGLARLSRRNGATLFMTLLAGFAALLHRVAGDRDRDELAVGTPVAGRTRVEVEPLIGFFVNTLVLRADFSGDPDPAALLDRVRETTLAAYAHQELPFERLVEEIAPERDRSRAPLVQVLFALQNAAVGPLELPGLELEAVALPSGTAKLDLAVSLRETAEGLAGLAGDIEYSRDLFDRATVERLAGRFVRLLAAIVADPLRPLSELPLLSESDRHQLLVEWNDAATAYPREACLPELFAAVVRETPEAPAIVASGEVWTYRRLDAASNRLARHLQSLGVGVQTPVCVSMERSPELIVGILAILKAGGLYVPLDAGYPDERLAFMLADAGAGIVLVHAATRERLAGRARLVEVGAATEEAGDGGPLGMRVPAESPAYVIYNSGSTGRPKGVTVPHRAVVRLVRETGYLPLGPGDRVAQVSNISFDAATWEIWGALLNGATLVVVPRDVVLAPSELAAALREQEVTSLILATALFTRVAREAPDAFEGVRDLLFGG